MPLTPTRDWLPIMRDAKARGIHRAQVAREQGVSAPTVSKWCSFYRIDLPKGTTRRAIADWPVVLADAAKRGLTLKEVAYDNNVSRPCVCRHTKRLGISLKGQHHTPRARAA
jgi:hypothetical protein